jgi:flagellin
MAVVINTNVASLGAQKNLQSTQNVLQRSMQRLSSGLRINTASDDAAGLAISESLRAQVRSLNQASRNASDGVSLLQTAEGALNEVSGILVRMRELAVQSANGVLSTEQRSSLHAEFTQLRDEIDRIGDSTQFNGVSLIEGSLASSGVTFQVGLDAASSSQLTVTIASAKSADIGSAASNAKLDSTSISSASGARSALAVLDDAIAGVTQTRGTIGAAMNRLASTVANLATAVENLSAANSRIRDVDVAEETAAMTRSQILMQAGVSVLAQANQAPSVALSLLR